MATTHAARFAEGFRLSKYTVGFIIVAVISILPETFIAIDSALSGVPDFGLGMLFGSNVADLTLIFALLVFYSGRSLKVETKILKKHATYPFILLLPLVLGLNGHFSRLEGLALIIAGATFYFLAVRDDAESSLDLTGDDTFYSKTKNLLMLLFSMAVLLVGAHFTVSSATAMAQILKISPVLIGMLVVGLGTTMPELFFSLKAVKKNDDSLAVGDLLGTVLADATIVVGIIALISPFYFPQKIIFVTGGFMLVASITLFRFMRSGHLLTKHEARHLLVFWLFFILVEFLVTI